MQERVKRCSAPARAREAAEVIGQRRPVLVRGLSPPRQWLATNCRDLRAPSAAGIGALSTAGPQQERAASGSQRREGLPSAAFSRAYRELKEQSECSQPGGWKCSMRSHCGT